MGFYEITWNSMKFYGIKIFTQIIGENNGKNENIKVLPLEWTLICICSWSNEVESYLLLVIRKARGIFQCIKALLQTNKTLPTRNETTNCL